MKAQDPGTSGRRDGCAAGTEIDTGGQDFKESLVFIANYPRVKRNNE